MAPHRWQRCAQTCSTACGNGEPARSWQPEEHCIACRARPIEVAVVDFDVVVSVVVDLDGDGDVDRDGTSLTVTSSS